MLLLRDKVVMISGAASPRGIGLATARVMAEHGATVVILDLDAKASEEAASSLGAGHLGFACDVADREQCFAATASTIAKLGRVDVLINNAGVTQAVGTSAIDADSWNRVLDINLRGTLHLSQAVIPHMQGRRRGSVVCMSSVSALRGGGIFGGPHYAAAKAGVLGLAKAMAREFGPFGIRVNCLAPGLIATDITSGKLDDAGRQKIIDSIPLGRLGDAAEVAGAYLFLACDLSSYVTGAVIDVNGGMLIH